jgi:NAD(P)-dependent dehydrogenase (short-subunit alcohol dehydrogenase family)
MTSLRDKTAIVVGGSRNTGRAISLALLRAGARVLVAARSQDHLNALRAEAPAIDTMMIDAATPDAPVAVFSRLVPNILILSIGVTRPGKPFFELDWEEFSRTWDNDVRASFNFCREAIRRPLPPSSVVIQISSGAGIGGSPISGGYAGAKRMQMFLANYAQKESDRLDLRQRFLTVIPMRPMIDTEDGRAAVTNYSRYLGVTERDFIAGMSGAQTSQDVANAVVRLAGDPPAGGANNFIVSATGVEPMN